MKLLNCLNCHDIFSIWQDEKLQYCKCGKSGGRYLEDGNTCEIVGPSRIIVILGPEYHSSISEKMNMAGMCYHWFGIIDHDPAVKRIDDTQVFTCSSRHNPAAAVHAIQVSNHVVPLVGNKRFREDTEWTTLHRLSKDTGVDEDTIQTIRRARIMKEVGILKEDKDE